MIVINGLARLDQKVTIFKREVAPLCTWCQEQLGPRFSIADREENSRDGVWQCLYSGYPTDGPPGYEFSFDHASDAMLFILRWL